MNNHATLVLAAVITVVFFILDIVTPLGYVVPLLYVIPEVIAIAAIRHSLILLLPLIASILEILGFIISPPGADQFKAMINHGMTIFVLWSLAFYMKKRKEAQEAFEELLGDMERRVNQRTRDLSESEKKFRDLTEQSMVGVYLLQDGRFKYANPQFARTFGYSVEALTDRSYRDLIAADDLAHIEECVQKRLSGLEQFGHYTFKGMTRSRDMIHLEVFNARTVYRGEPAVIGSVVDITERVKLESERAEYEKELVEARETAEKANRAKSQFLANMSHELRTPLNGILGVLQMFLHDYLGPLQGRQREFLVKAQKSAQALLQIITDILDLSRVEAHKMVIEEKPFSVKECVSEVADYFLSAALDKGVSFIFTLADNVPGMVVGDKLRLRQVLSNLIGNAIKFTEHGNVLMEVQSGHTRDTGKRELRFIITDTGIGIPDEKKHLLFKTFSQVDDSDTRKFGGTGLGLAISQDLVELMGGTIYFASEEGQGSSFSFTIPLREYGGSESVQPGSVAVTEPLPEKEITVRILVAEDDPMASELLRNILEFHGLEMDLTQTGLEVVEKSQRGDYDLIIMDVQMPKMDGITATRAIREKEKESGKHIPIVAMTAHAYPEDEKRCRAAGMDGYLTKPLDLEKGMEIILALINK